MFLPVQTSLSKEHPSATTAHSTLATSPSSAPTVVRSSAAEAASVCTSVPSPPVCMIDTRVNIEVAVLDVSAVRRGVVGARKDCTRLVRVDRESGF